MANEDTLLQCYNRGCGMKFDPTNNDNDSCVHHPGLPFFHDAYKGWTCCNKKSINFTDFLNMKGCSKARHSNIKPVDPEQPPKDTVKEVMEVKPMASVVRRPPIDSPLVNLKAEITAALKQQLESNEAFEAPAKEQQSDEIAVGTACKRGGCKVSYEGPQTDHTTCLHHPGSPIFHEGMKYWSCCKKRTSDFTVFLNQVGCTRGQHLWRSEGGNAQEVECKWDWHQTALHVIVSVYAKHYHPTLTMVQLNPIRLFASVVFPRQENATFTLDLELEGVVDVKASQVSMSPSKIEIKLKKAEPGSWTRVNIAKPISKTTKKIEDNPTPPVESVDLEDL